MHIDKNRSSLSNKQLTDRKQSTNDVTQCRRTTNARVDTCCTPLHTPHAWLDTCDSTSVKYSQPTLISWWNCTHPASTSETNVTSVSSVNWGKHEKECEEGGEMGRREGRWGGGRGDGEEGGEMGRREGRWGEGRGDEEEGKTGG